MPFAREEHLPEIKSLTPALFLQIYQTQILNNVTPINLLNPIASQLAVMRSSLLPGLVENIRYNLSHKASRVRVFEVGRVFHRDTAAQDISGIAQPLILKLTMKYARQFSHC